MSHSDETPSSIPSPEWQQQAPRLRVPHRSHRFSTLCAVVIIYLAAAYMVVPLTWMRFERRHPATMNVSRVTVTGDQHPGDPVHKSVGFSHTTGQITHHIDGNVDAERDHLMETLKHAGKLNQIQAVRNFHQIREGRNGGGDLWHTDGRLLTATLSSRD